MKIALRFLLIFVMTLLAQTAGAVSGKMTVSGRLLKPDGTAVNSSSVKMAFSLMDPGNSCTIYTETSAILDLSSSDGNFDVILGSGTVTYPTSPALSLKEAFKNSSTFNCSGSGSYTAGVDDIRMLSIQFIDQNESTPTWRSFTSAIALNAVANAMYAESAAKLDNHPATDFLLNSLIPTCSAGTFLTWSGTALTCAAVSGVLQSGATAGGDLSGTLPNPTVAKLQGKSVSLTTPTSGDVLQFNGTAWAPAQGAAGSVTSVTSANSYLSVATGTTTPALTLNVGTTANTVAAGNDSRITGALQSGATAGGDLSGTLPNPTVAKLQGTGVSSTTPTTSQILKFNGSAWAPGSITVPEISGLAVSCAVSETMYWNSVSSTFACQSIDINAFVKGGNSFGAGAILGTKDSNTLTVITNNTARLTIDTSGNLGVGNTSPKAKIDVQGGAIVAASQSSSTSCVNFLTGNVQVSSFSSSNSINVGGLMDGGAYTLVLTGYTAGQTVTINAYTDAACATAISYGVDFGGSSSGPVPSFMAVGNTQVITLIYSAARGIVYGSAATNYYR